MSSTEPESPPELELPEPELSPEPDVDFFSDFLSPEPELSPELGPGVRNQALESLASEPQKPLSQEPEPELSPTGPELSPEPDMDFLSPEPELSPELSAGPDEPSEPDGPPE